jgi:hypothetical protein
MSHGSMIDDEQIADDLISGRLKRARSYHSDYGQKTYGEIKRLASARPPDVRARQMKKLIEQAERLRNKERRRS